ncbi:MAG: hypothetical protein J5589_05065 [Firmicutes bacterium]|nr:hypothetical protein [Bacillota bacterium]
MPKRLLIIIVCLLAAVLLIACSQATPDSPGKKSDKFETDEVEEESFESGPKKQSVTDHTCTIHIAGQEFTGLFTGILNEDKPEGEGKFKSDKLIYTGTFNGDTADTGKIGGFPMTIMLQGNVTDGIYQGDVTSGQMSGEGSFTSDSLVYQGTFESGVPSGSGTITGFPCSVTIAELPLTGSYTGPISSFLPEGEGAFEADKTKYTGTFKEGAAVDGTVADLALSLNITETSYAGFYSGAVTGGMLTGSGTFTADAIKYTGSFEASALKDGSIENFPLKVTVQGTELSGAYSGAVTGGVLTGSGTFTADAVKYTGSFEAGTVKDGSIESFPLKVTVYGTEISGTYQGPVAAGALTGDASFTSDSLSYTGTFSSGAMTGDGTFSSISASITFQDHSFSGTYAGQTAAFLPSGEGSFDAPADAEGYYLSFSGTFSQGALGTGTLKTNHCGITFGSDETDSYTHLGTYEGPLTDGALSGTDCHFSAVNDYHISYDQTGNVVNGSFNGPAIATYHMPDGDLIFERTYENGVPLYTTPSSIFALRMIAKEYGQNLIPLITYNFIKTHEQAFFYGADSSEVEALVSDVTYMQSYNDPVTYAGKVIKMEGATFYNSNLWDDYPGGYALLWFTLTTPDDNNHVIWLGVFGTLEEMTALQAEYTKGQAVSFIAVPIQPRETDENGNLYQEFLCAKLY